MEQKLKEFSYDGATVRTHTDEEGQTWFVGVDVCNVLGYAMPSNVIKDKLDDDERRLTNLSDGSGQKRRTWTINESGLYCLILSSSKPSAKMFRKWVTHEVLPAIRKAGQYSTEPAIQKDQKLRSLQNRMIDLGDDIAEKQKELRLLKKEFYTLVNTDLNQLALEFKDNGS